MQKESKIQLTQMMSLMERMDKHYTNDQAKMLTENKLREKNLLSEAKTRKQVTRDEILDILDEQDRNGKGRFASFTYVKPVAVKKTKKSWDKPGVDAVLANYKDSEEQWYKDISDFNREDTTLKKNPIAAIVVAQRYVIHWASPESYGKAYGNYADQLSNLRQKYGIATDTAGVLGDNNNQRTQSAGQTFNQTGNLARDFNMAHSTVKLTNYIVDEAGHIVSEIPNDITRAISSQKKSYSVEATVAAALADNPEALKEYEQAKAELDKAFRGQNFIFDRILSIVASVDGIDYYYINDKLLSPIAAKSEINVDQAEMVEIAKEQLQQSFNDIDVSDFAN